MKRRKRYQYWYLVLPVVTDPGPEFFDPSIRDPDPGWEKSGSGMSIPDHFSESLETVFLVKK
jgi:hypothetical protein